MVDSKVATLIRKLHERSGEGRIEWKILPALRECGADFPQRRAREGGEGEFAGIVFDDAAEPAHGDAHHIICNCREPRFGLRASRRHISKFPTLTITRRSAAKFRAVMG